VKILLNTNIRFDRKLAFLIFIMEIIILSCFSVRGKERHVFLRVPLLSPLVNRAAFVHAYFLEQPRESEVRLSSQMQRVTFRHDPSLMRENPPASSGYDAGIYFFSETLGLSSSCPRAKTNAGAYAPTTLAVNCVRRK
jgi:hypothetical protein